MRYSVNYRGAFFVGDNEGVNTVGFDRFDEARSLLWDVIQCGCDENAYMKDEEYQCSLYRDRDTKEFYWIG